MFFLIFITLFIHLNIKVSFSLQYFLNVSICFTLFSYSRFFHIKLNFFVWSFCLLIQYVYLLTLKFSFFQDFSINLLGISFLFLSFLFRKEDISRENVFLSPLCFLCELQSFVCWNFLYCLSNFYIVIFHK